MILIGRSPSPGFVYIGAGAPLPPDAKIPKSLKGMDMGAGEMAKVTFESNDPSVGRGFPEREPANLPARLKNPILQNESYMSIEIPLYIYCIPIYF